MDRERGSLAVVVTISPPNASTIASTVPSPPSATFTATTSQSGRTALIPRVAAWAPSMELSEPLKESEAITIFIFLSLTDDKIYCNTA